jgi:tRNA threonylcarbamoyl adenosine modification protein (Sua5/YciO/YrdC/YwlC family)
MTRLKLYGDFNRQTDLDQVVDVLNEGELILLPTDLRYVVGCHALRNQAVERLLKWKGRGDDARNKLTLICHSISQISDFARIDNETFRLMKRNTPGPFTFILPGLNRLPKILSKRKEVGVRIPENPVLYNIVEALDAPIMVSSLPQEPIDVDYYTNPELAEEHFGDEVALTIDGGVGCDGQTTVVNCTGASPVIERQGSGELIM